MPDSRYIQALLGGDEAAIASAVDRLEDLERPDEGGQTPLMHAALHRRCDAVQRLLDRGADPMRLSRTAQGLETPFHIALRQRDERSAVILLHAGRARAASRSRRKLTGLEGEELVSRHLAREFEPAAEALERMLRSGLDPNAAIFDHIPLFSYCALFRNAVAVGTLLQWGHDRDQPIESAGGHLLSPLHVAAEAALDDIVWLLLLDGADAHRIDARHSPLFMAVRSGSPTTAQLLLDAGADVERGLGSETPLMEAVQLGHRSTVELLLTRGANVNGTSASGWSPLHYAAQSDQVAIARRLLDLGADPLHVDKEGLNATDHATRHFDPIYAQIYRDWGIPDRYSVGEVDDDWQLSGEFDVFISYRHGRYAALAAELAEALRRLRARPFIDRECLGVLASQELSDSVLKSRLATAIRRSRLLVFFESYTDADGAESKSGISWQFFELLHARTALLVSFDAGTCKRWVAQPGKRLAANDVVCTFRGVEDLASQLLLQLA